MTALAIWIAAWILLSAGASVVVIRLMRRRDRRLKEAERARWQAQKRDAGGKDMMSDWLRNRGRNGFDRGGGGAP